MLHCPLSESIGLLTCLHRGQIHLYICLIAPFQDPFWPVSMAIKLHLYICLIAHIQDPLLTHLHGDQIYLYICLISPFQYPCWPICISMGMNFTCTSLNLLIPKIIPAKFSFIWLCSFPWENQNVIMLKNGLGLWYLTPPSTIFQLYCGGNRSQYPEKTTALPHVPDVKRWKTEGKKNGCHWF